MNRIRLGVCFAVLGLLILSTSLWATDFSKPIKKIIIQGASRADVNTVRFYIHSKPGEIYNSTTVQEDIRRVYKLGFFDDIQLDAREEADGLILTFIFKEKPFVRTRILTGNDEVDSATIHESLKTKRGTFFRQDYIPLDELKIKQLYRQRGFHFAEVRTVVHKLENDQVDVEYIIKEGGKIDIGKIIFRGNKAIPDYVLREKIETKPENWSSFLSDSGSMDKDVLKADVLRLEAFYHEQGYIKVKVGAPEVEIDKENRKIYVSFSIEENRQFRVGNIEIEGDEVNTKEELAKQISLKKGDVFNRSVFRKDIFNITDLYSQKGYAFANVVPETRPIDEAGTVDVKVRVKKGRKVYIGRMTITGNEKTRDRVIRREFLLHEGEVYNSAKLRRSRERVNSLGFFESVEILQKSRQEEDLIDIGVKVVERETGEFSFAVGYSSLENVVIQGSVKWKNLLGYGQEFGFSLDTSSRRNDYTVNFTEPSLFDRKLSAGFDVFNKEYEYDAFLSRSIGFSMRLGRGIGEYTWAKIGYRYEENDVTIIDREEASSYLLGQEGARTTGSIFPSITYDTRNDPYSPTTGKRIYGYMEFAGLGGNQQFYKLTAEYSHYRPMFLDFVGLFHSKIGFANGYDGATLPVYERFFAGGPRSIRGFTLRDIGPLDENGEAIGGEALLLFNLELQYRFTRYFRGFLFYDRGNVYGTNDELNNTTDKYFDLEEMRHSWGFGIHFFSPIGPISVIYGFKLDQRENESPSEFHFTIGGAF